MTGMSMKNPTAALINFLEGNNEIDNSCEGVGGQVAAELDETVQDLENNTTFVAEDINIEAKSDVEMEKLFTAMLSTSAVDDDPINQGRMMNGEAEQQTQITQTADDLSVVPMQVMCQHPQGHDDSILQTLCNELIEMCRTSRMVFEMNPMLTIQCAGSEHCDNVRAAVPENNQSFSDMKIVVHSKNIVQGEFQETSNTAGLTDKLKESPRLSGNPEDILSATSKSKKIVVGPEVALYCKMDADETTETPLKGLGVWKTMHDSTLTNLAISVEEISVKQDTKACYEEQPMNPRMGQTCVFCLWMEEGCWICYIQDANGRMWERTCRDSQIHHVQPD
ncbi:unnamed protein product [Sphagnum jensenii]|uniref:Uncharacterized protein n=1 Tax=Sphagnum jensenii TaxID=128206 RepID=A0ABP0VPY3_9BRYO